MATRMAHGFDYQGLVFAFSSDADVFARLITKMPAQALSSDAVRIAACGTVFQSHDIKEYFEPHLGLKVYLLPANGLEGQIAGHLEDEPLLRACFDCLAANPSGGAPWQGSWRSNSLVDVCRGLRNGGMIFVAASETLDEQRTWARALLQIGCAFVQIHNGSDALAAPLPT